MKRRFTISSQEPFIGFFHEPVQSGSHTDIPFLYGPIQHCPPVYSFVSQLVSLPLRFYGFAFLVALRSTQPLTEMSTRNLPGGKGRPARKVDNLTAVSRLSRKCGSHDVSHFYGLPRPVTEIALIFFTSFFLIYPIQFICINLITLIILSKAYRL
jgi:hypothetical protein